MNEMDDINNEDRDSEIRDKLREIVKEIKESWARDTDKTEYMIKFIEMLKEMITHDTLEEYFSNNEKDLSLFMGDCLQEIINHILIQPIIYGDNGDKIGLNLLYHIFKLFLKFHKNNKYAPLFERIRSIFNNKEHSTSFLLPINTKMEKMKANMIIKTLMKNFVQNLEKKIQAKSLM